MSLDLSGSILEGVKLGTSSNPFVYPPRNFVQDFQQAGFNASARRSDYLLFPTGQVSGTDGLIISDDNLRFFWSRNDAVFRFDYDSATQRFAPAIGGVPTALGTMSNTNRLVAPVPSVADVSTAPYSIYLGLPRIATFSISYVESPAFFSSIPAGVVQLALSNGQLNFSASDLVNPAYTGVQVYVSRQDFFDRSSFTGVVATIDSTGDYLAFLNPVPANGQPIFLRVGGSDFLSITTFTTESSMPVPAIAGTANVALDTGRVLLHDPASLEGQSLTYEGIALGEYALSQAAIASITASLSSVVYVATVPAFVNISDASRYSIFARKAGKPDYFLPVSISSGIPDIVRTGTSVVDATTGGVFISSADSSRLAGYQLRYVDSYIIVDQDITLQVYRSGVNGTGVSQVPDFVEYYNVTNATIVSSLTSSPMVLLPAEPVVNSTLTYKVESSPGSAGFFTGTLVKASDTGSNSIGYSLDLNSGMFKFSNRKDVTVDVAVATSQVTLGDPSIFIAGFQLSRNGTPLTEDVDYGVNYSAGVVSFYEDKGSGSSIVADAVSGTADPYPSFTTSQLIFDSSYIGAYIYIAEGVNAGYRQISGVLGPNTVAVSTPWVQTGSVVVNIRSSYETIANNFWRQINPPLKKFSLFKSQSATGPFTQLSTSEFSVVAEVGQITLSTYSEPGSFYKADYISLGADSTGSFVIPTARSEFLCTRIRAETALYTPGSRQVQINPNGYQVKPSRGIRVSINGIAQPVNSYSFTAPGTLTLTTLLTDETVLVDYWIDQTVGGSLTFNTDFRPIDVDYATFVENATTASLNGDLTSVLLPNSAVRLGSEVYLVASASYSSTDDKTLVVFTRNIRNTYVGSFEVSSPVSFATPFTHIGMFAANSSDISFAGSISCTQGSLITLAGDLYYVASSEYVASTNRTNVSLSSSLFRSYVSPVVSISVDPVLNPGSSFSTRSSLVLTEPFNLFKSGSENRELDIDVDFTIADGGSIQLAAPLVYGDSLVASYVARDIQPVGTSLTANYAHWISPNSTNGLIGQKLLSTYILYNPDSFYFRKETLESFLPEVSSAISSSSGPSPSGPTTSAPATLSLQDNGIASIEFNSRKYYNLSLADRRLVLYYNQITNAWNLLQSALDGRVIGGTSGLFRFDDSEGTLVDNLEQATNDIYDRIYLYRRFRVDSFFPLTFSYLPVYRRLADYSIKSRLFPTRANSTFAINNLVTPEQEDEVMGNLNYTNITRVGTIKTAKSIAKFSKVSGASILIEANGDPDNLLPPFVEGMAVYLFDDLGGQYATGLTITSISSSSGGYILILDGPIPFERGSLSTNNSFYAPSYEINKFYVPNQDIGIDSDSGDLVNISSTLLQTLDFQQEVTGDAVYTSQLNYGNTATAPRRIPALFGEVLTDDGLVSDPLMTYDNESDLLTSESEYLSSTTFFGKAHVSSGSNYLAGLTFPVNVGDRLVFTEGPNAGISVLVLISYGTSALISPGLPTIDATQYWIVKESEYNDYLSTLNREILVVKSGVASPAVSPQKIGTLDSEITQLTYLARNYGDILYTGSATILSSSTIQISGQSLTSGSSYFIWVGSGPNSGYYKVASAVGDIFTLDGSFPYGSFTSVGTINCELISRYSFLTDSGSETIANGLKNAYQFADSTEAWVLNPDPSLFASRLNTVNNRISQVNALVADIDSVCNSGDSLYERRFLWITQLVDKKTGFLTLQSQAEQSQAENRANLLAAQQKQLALQSLV